MPSNLNLLHETYVADPIDANLATLLEAVRAFALRRATRATGLDAEDIAQQTVIAVWQALPTYTGGSSFITFVTAIAQNKIKDALRQRYAAPKIEPMQSWEADLHIPCNTPDERSSVLGEFVDDIFEGLPINDSDRALLLQLAQGIDRVQIAADLGIGQPALRSRIARLKKKVTE
jgi:RNA polymerase sigma-70 factor, ECF subfamily